MQRHQRTPYSRPTPAHGQAPGVPSSGANARPIRSQIQERHIPVQPYSNYTPNSPQSPQPGPFPPYSQQQQQRPTMPTYSAQTLRSVASQQIPAMTPEAAMVPIQSLQPERSFVRVSGRTVRAPDVKAFPNKWDPTKQTWLQSFTIKDDLDTIDVKFWHKTQEHLSRYSHITLDQVVHIWTDEVKLNTKSYGNSQASNAPSTSSPFLLSLGEGKVGHRIEVGSEEEMANSYKVALGANLGGVVPSVSIKQVISAMGSVGSQRFNLIVCVKKLVSSAVINSKNGPLVKTLYTVFDTQGQEAALTMWGETMAQISQQWIPQQTTLIITGAQVSMYMMKPQITIGYQAHIQVDPVCKNIEGMAISAGEIDDVRIDQIKTSYHIVDLSKLIDTMGPLEITYGFTFAILCELEIDTIASELLTAKCPMCQNAINSCKMEACSKCHVAPTTENMWHYNLARYISFMDDTAELRHPNISSDVVQKCLGYTPGQFSTLSIEERSQLKKRFYLERFKVHFKVSWSDQKKQHIVQIVAMARAQLSEIEHVNRTH
ncbi:hypothetical protein BGX33_004706 [Mortierella sp. NVP41]|nr:hypothetical protein BGX33_004706 [Mortierella sp. NVP41]